MAQRSSNFPDDFETISRVTTEFTKFLEGCKPPPTFCHVVFRCGTVARLDIADEVELFTSFENTSYIEGYPTHRVVNDGDLDRFVSNAKHDYAWAMSVCKPKHKALISRAYTLLIDDGYPFPGGSGADRTAVPMSIDGTTMATYFYERNPYVFTVTSTIIPDNIRVTRQQLMEWHISKGSEHRRLDYMFPQVYAVIDGIEICLLSEQ